MRSLAQKKFYIFAVFVGILILLSPLRSLYAEQVDEKKRASFGFIVDSRGQRGVEFFDIVKREILVLMGQEYDVRFDPKNIIYTEYDNQKVDEAFETQFNNPDVDIVLAFGVMSSVRAYKLRDLPKPVIAPFVLSTEIADIPFKDGTSGVHNLNYLCLEGSNNDLLVEFADMAGMDTDRRMVLVFDRSFALAVPELKEELEKLAKKANLDFQLIVAGSNADEVLAKIPHDLPAVCIGPLLEMPKDEFDKLIAGFNERKIPSFSVWGEDAALQGVLASVGPRADNLLYARRIALNVQRIMFGEDPAGFDVFIPNSDQLFVNVQTARSIGISPSWEVLSKAVLIGDDKQPESANGVLSVRQCAQMALDSNFSILARRKEVQAGRQDYLKAVGGLLPTASVGLSGVMIDKDRARASLGATAEKTLTFSATLDQLIFSDKIWANKTVQKMFDLGRKSRLNGYEQDIVQNTTIAYYTVLQALADERVQKQNLDLTKSNLELAQVRRNSGVAGPAEVYRWESELAKSRKDFVLAQTQRKKAQMELAAIVSLPLEDVLSIRDIDGDEVGNIFSKGRMSKYLKNPNLFKIFRDFMVKKGLELSPELISYDYSIKAQRRLLTSARRSYFLPDVSLSAQYNNYIDRWGVGSGDTDGQITSPDDDDWQVAINGSLSLFEGGAKLAENRQAKYTLEQLRFERDDLAQQTETNIRSLLMDSMYSAASIDLSREEYDSASKNLDVIKDSYSRGTVSILDLLDAQTSALVAAQVAEAAVYKHLINVAKIRRAVGVFVFKMTPEQNKAFQDEMEEYFEVALSKKNKVEAEI